MEEEKYSVLVVGSGQCGGQIAAIFDKKPSFLKSRREDHYPINCFVFDTDPEMKNNLIENWDFRSEDNILILPSATEKDIENFILEIEEEKADIDIASELKRVGIGGLPILGRIAGKLNFVDHKEEMSETLFHRIKPSKTLLAINSLTGGTGTGFSPFVIDFLKSIRELTFILNLSVIPADFEALYPNSVISSLYHMLKVDSIDGIILVDNAKMQRKPFRCRNFYEYNSKIHEILSPILLSPMGKYTASYFGASLDPADLKRWTRTHLGFGNSDLCALGYSSEKTGIFQKREDFLQDLADKAIKSTTIDCDPKTSMSGVAVLSASPKFYKKFLREDAGYYDWLVEHLRKNLNNRRLKLSFLQFEDMKEVCLSILISGINSSRVVEICEAGGFEMRGSGSIGDQIRKLPDEEVDREVKKEMREYVMKKIGGEK